MHALVLVYACDALSTRDLCVCVARVSRDWRRRAYEALTRLSRVRELVRVGGALCAALATLNARHRRDMVVQHAVHARMHARDLQRNCVVHDGVLPAPSVTLVHALRATHALDDAHALLLALHMGHLRELRMPAAGALTGTGLTHLACKLLQLRVLCVSDLRGVCVRVLGVIGASLHALRTLVLHGAGADGTGACADARCAHDAPAALRGLACLRDTLFDVDVRGVVALDTACLHALAPLRMQRVALVAPCADTLCALADTQAESLCALSLTRVATLEANWLARLPALRALSLRACPQLAHVRALAVAPLVELELDRCPRLHPAHVRELIPHDTLVDVYMLDPLARKVRTSAAALIRIKSDERTTLHCSGPVPRRRKRDACGVQ